MTAWFIDFHFICWCNVTYFNIFDSFYVRFICYDMFRQGITPLLALFVICSFCGCEFKSLGRHAWRYNAMLKTADKEAEGANKSSKSCIAPVSIDSQNKETASNCSHVKCCWCKVYNGLRGLKMRQRSCRVIRSLGEETFENGDQDTDTG